MKDEKREAARTISLERYFVCHLPHPSSAAQEAAGREREEGTRRISLERFFSGVVSCRQKILEYAKGRLGQGCRDSAITD